MKKEQAIKECETLKRCLMQYSDEPNNIKSGQAIETVLNMLKEKDAKIEHLEEKRENQKVELAILNEKQKEMNKLINTVSSYKGMVKKEQKDNKKKDKIIDLYIDKLARDEFDDCCQECCRECERDYDTLSNCIKQYFERKATNNG